MSISAERQGEVLRQYGKIPMYFIPNQGQLNQEDICFYTQKGTFHTGFTAHSVVMTWAGEVDPEEVPEEKNRQAIAISFRFIHPNPHVHLQGDGLQEGKVSFFRGNDPDKWMTGIPTYQQVLYTSLWSKVDATFYDNHGQLKYDFILHPGGDVRDIQFAVDGAEDLWLDEDGNLHIQTSLGTVTKEKPFSYQKIDGEKRIVESNFIFRKGENDEKIVGVSVAENYSQELPLIIDPPVTLDYSTYLGGASSDSGNGIAIGDDGSAYVTGSTSSLNFPTTMNAFQSALAGGSDAFVTKFSPDGMTLVYSTYLGGTLIDQGNGIAVGNDGSVYITGSTNSPDFPTINAFQSSLIGMTNAFVTKFNPDGTLLEYSTYLGGESGESGNAIAVDNNGSAYVTGVTASLDFPTINAFQGFLAGGFDAFITKFNPDGITLDYSTYLGGGSNDSGNAIAIGNDGSAYVTGYTQSLDFPTINPFQGALAGNFNAFVTKLNPNGMTLTYSTYLGGNSYDEGNAIVAGDDHSAYVTGITFSPDFPTMNPFQSALAGSSDAFVTKFNPNGMTLTYSTYLGGSALDQGVGIAIDSSGNAYVTGSTQSLDFPTINAFQSVLAGNFNAFVTKLTPDGMTLFYSTYLGGTLIDQGNDIAVGDNGSAYVTGVTISSNFPTINPFQSSIAGGSDAFVTKLFFCCPSSISLSATPTLLDPCTFTLTGTVLCSDDSPVSDATVTFIPSTGLSTPPDATTDIDGNYSSQVTIDCGTSGAFTASVSIDGCEPITSEPADVSCACTCTITCPLVTPVTADCGETGAVVTYPTPIPGNGCPPMTTVLCTPPSGSFFPIGSTNVICEALDENAQTIARCTMLITVLPCSQPSTSIQVIRVPVVYDWIILNSTQTVTLSLSPTTSTNALPEDV